MRFDAAGNLASETYPNGLTATTGYDNDNNPSTVAYAKAGSTWLSFTAGRDADGKIRTQTGPASSQSYLYDNADRLTTVQDTVASSCTTRSYGFETNSNRTSLTSYPAGTCTTTTPAVVSSSYDQADRLTATGYSYDTLGRTLTVPAGDAQGIGANAATTGTLTLDYYVNDLIHGQTQGSATRTFTLDPLQNRIATTSDGTTTTNHYSGDDDSPDWTSTATTWTRNIAGPDGNLAATQDQTGTVTLQLANLHGDLVATAPDDPTATTPSSYSESTEYGQPRDPASAPTTYGWLGTKHRSSNTLGGLTLMGVRLYNPSTGRFTTVDPVAGGNANAYSYPTDPVDGSDLNGRCGLFGNPFKKCKKHKNNGYSTAKDGYGNKIVTRPDVLSKIQSRHNISVSAMKRGLRNAYRYRDPNADGTTFVYRDLVQRISCGWWSCKVVASVWMRLVVNFRTNYNDNQQQGLVTAYCEGMVRCFDWVNQ